MKITLNPPSAQTLSWDAPAWLDFDIASEVTHWWAPWREDLITLDVNDKPEVYLDQVTGFPLDQTVEANRLTFLPTGYNGRPTLQSAAGQFMSNPNHNLPLGAEVCETFIILDQQEVATSERWAFEWGVTGNDSIARRSQRRIGKASSSSINRLAVIVGRSSTFNLTRNTTGPEFNGKFLASVNWVQDTSLRLNQETATISDSDLDLATLAGPVTLCSSWVGLVGDIINTRALTEDKRSRLITQVTNNLMSVV